MIWPFTKNRKTDTPELHAAQAAQDRAEVARAQVSARTDEVEIYYMRLKRRRLQNNFGDALVAAMERR